MREKDHAGTFMGKNTDYVKRRDGSPDKSEAPRETPGQQGPGQAGHDLPDYSRWTTVELRSHAVGLGIADAKDLGREALIEALIENSERR